MSAFIDGLVEADRRCLEAAELLLDNLELVPSATAYNSLLDAIARAKEAAAGASHPSVFERLFAKHLTASWEVLAQVARYRFEFPRGSVDELLESIAGPGAVERLERAISGIEPEQVVAYLEERRRYSLGRISAGAPQARPLVEETLGALAGLFKKWLAAREGDAPGLDAEVVLGASESDRSWYSPARRRVVIGPGEFMVFENGGGLTVNPVAALVSLAHELGGHAVQDALSKDLPEPLRPGANGRLRFASLAAFEGFADYRASMALAFAQENRSALSLSAGDLSLLRVNLSMAFLHNALPAYAAVLVARARVNPSLDPSRRLAEVTGQGGFGEMIERVSRDPVNRLIYNASCWFGLAAVREAAAELDRAGVAEPEKVRRLGRGGWSLACYREAVTAAS